MNDYDYQQSLCNSGEDDLTWAGALDGCSACVEQDAALPQGTIQDEVNTALFGNGGSQTGFCNAPFQPGVDSTVGYEQLVAAGSTITSEYGLTILYFNMTEISH